MSEPSARGLALEALRRWRKPKKNADAIVADLFAATPLSAPDRAFALGLFYGVLRNLTLLDFWIGCLRRSHLAVDLRDILRLGLYQLFLLETPAHAAVNETVELAPKRGRELINAVLRAAARRGGELRQRAVEQPLSVRESHPPFLIARWEENFGRKAAEELCRWNNQPPPLYARINRLKIESENFVRLYHDARVVVGAPEFVTFETMPAAAVERGDCYIQDPSTALACRLLETRPGEKVLDACAAPGGKTAYIAELLQNDGMLVACDRAPERLSLLQHNLERLGAPIVETFQIDWTRDAIPEQIAAIAPFDRVLVDAPCTNTGVMRRRVDVRWRLTPDDFMRMRSKQIDIVQAVLPLLKQGGVLVYSTCSLEPEENEQLVQGLLEQMSILQLEEEKRSLPFRDGFDGAFAARLVKTAAPQR
ncbi:MAG: 16S rRNA (cytosine(967)-C(5))-methyltransferase RsmB [Chthoniobacterales bacterium]